MRYLTFLLLLILSFIIYNQCNEISILNSKVSALDYKLDNVNKKQFPTVQNNDKESFYLTQLSNSTTLILSVIGFSLVLAGISSFIIIKERFEIFDTSTKQKINNVRQEIEVFRTSNTNIINTYKAEINDKIHKYETEYEKIKHTIYYLKNDLDYELVTLKNNEAKEAFSRQDLNGYVFYVLLSSRYSVDCIKYYRSIKSNLAESMLDMMNNKLVTAKLDLDSLLKFNQIQKHSLPEKDKESVINLIKSINDVSDTKTFEILSSIFNTLSFDK